jgi:hypothetical protein
MRILFIDYSSAFNTMMPCKLITKLRTLGPDGTQAVRCQDNDLSLNVGKTTGLIVDYRKRRAKHARIHVVRAVMEQVESFKFLISTSLMIMVQTSTRS